MNEMMHLIDDYEDQENFYLLTNLWYSDTVTMETTVINTLAITDWSEGFVWRIEFWHPWRGCCFYSKCVKFADYWWFSRVSEAWKEDRLSEGIPGISKSGQFLPFWSYSWPRIADRVMWYWALTVAQISSSHLNICEDDYGRVALSDVWSWSNTSIQMVIWMVVLTNWSKPGLDIIIVLWTQGLWTLPCELQFYHTPAVIICMVLTV